MQYYEFREECEKRSLNIRSILSNNKALFDLLVANDDDKDDEIIETLDREERRWINDIK